MAAESRSTVELGSTPVALGGDGGNSAKSGHMTELCMTPEAKGGGGGNPSPDGMGIVTLKHGRPTFTSPGPTIQPKKCKRRDMEEPSRDTTSSTPATSNMHSFSRHFEDRLNRIESKLDRILAHFHIPPD
ncbi:hypothetical protein BUALT_Bualt02G0113400 [Buddleja alternifolia]|uniref:Uncharacterized protein n=1 Tax=Buddleja alternifolia TaxID=168488 RepID=A0AAV6Y641_9LAMI|nr:hypothetical protein BUALT_Bualt02G0113400 [Buddleja alternifolia]